MCIRDSLEGGRGEESVSFLDEEVDAAVQAVGGDGILHQTPDPLDGIVLVSAVLRQPEEAEAGMVGPSPPGPNELGVVGDDVVEGQDDLTRRVCPGQGIQECDELAGALARADQVMESAGTSVERAEQRTLGILARRRDSETWPLHPARPDHRQQVEVALVEIEEGGRRRDGLGEQRQLECRRRVLLPLAAWRVRRRGQAWPCPAPAGLVAVSYTHLTLPTSDLV